MISTTKVKYIRGFTSLWQENETRIKRNRFVNGGNYRLAEIVRRKFNKKMKIPAVCTGISVVVKKNNGNIFLKFVSFQISLLGPLIFTM